MVQKYKISGEIVDIDQCMLIADEHTASGELIEYYKHPDLENQVIIITDDTNSFLNIHELGNSKIERTVYMFMILYFDLNWSDDHLIHVAKEMSAYEVENSTMFQNASEMLQYAIDYRNSSDNPMQL